MSPGPATDQLQRPLGVLRLSLTARCNLACPYCQPDGEEAPDRLTTEQRLRVIEAACSLGVSSLRLTGGEPLLTPDLEELLEAIGLARRHTNSPLRDLSDIALTTNGLLLSPERAQRLRRAGLQRITISLDAVAPERVGEMSGRPHQGAQLLQQVLAAIAAAKAAGFDPAVGALKLNSVIQRGRNDDQLLPLAALARDQGLELRLIETMDVGNRNGWSPEQVVPAAEMIERLGSQWPLEPLGRPTHGTASRWRYRDGRGAVAVVASITQPFCGDCNRLRVTANGMAYTCLFASQGQDLKPWLQTPESLRQAIGQLWNHRRDRYSEERASRLAQPKAEMAYLGG
ncbi:MAG: GTP 3',8-cyclase MoaA [Cyanobacteria bacterium]|nr:GTP 3',8-cyclase MoaA [Cyanobacteriota bacterium]